MKPLKNPSKIKYLTYPFLLFNLANEKSITNKKIKPIISATSSAGISTANSKSLPKRR